MYFFYFIIMGTSFLFFWFIKKLYVKRDWIVYYKNKYAKIKTRYEKMNFNARSDNKVFINV